MHMHKVRNIATGWLVGRLTSPAAVHKEQRTDRHIETYRHKHSVL